MAKAVKAAMPPDVDIGPGWTVEFAAIDPTTGADVAGVVVSAAMIEAKDLTGQGGAGLASGPFMLVPGPGA